MRELLRKLGLLVQSKVKVEIRRADFIEKMKLLTGEPGFIVTDALVKNKYAYTGTVTEKSFELKKRRTLFDDNLGLVVAIGKFNQTNGALTIESEIFVPEQKVGPWLLFYIVFHFIFIIAALQSDQGPIILPIVLIFGGIMAWAPLSMLRKEVVKMKDQLEAEFLAMKIV